MSNWQHTSATTTAPSAFWYQRTVACCFAIERFNRSIGLMIAWLVLFMAIIVFAVVILRYGFNTGSIRLQESALYMHGLLFMLAATYCMQQGQHVRIDILYSSWTPTRRALIDLLGTLVFLIPVAIFSFVIAWDYVISSWQYLEKSREPGGLPLVFALKTAILIMPFTLFLQGITDAWRHYCFLRGWISYPQQKAKGSSLF